MANVLRALRARAVQRDPAPWAQEVPMLLVGLRLPSKEKLRETYVAAPVELPLLVLSSLEPLTEARCSSAVPRVLSHLLRVFSKLGLCALQSMPGFLLTTKRIGSPRQAPSAMIEYGICA